MKRFGLRYPGDIFLVLMLMIALLSAAWPPGSALAAQCAATYTVKPNDSLSAVAIKYDVKVESLVLANKLYAPNFTIYVAQKLCIPTDAPPLASIPGYANKLAADFKAAVKNNNLILTTTHFPLNNGFYVKVGPAGSAPAQRIGLIKTINSSNGNYLLTLPETLKKTKRIAVCLKNYSTDANVCRIATR
jgi:LysM repeat protein